MPNPNIVPGRTQRARHSTTALLNAAETKGARMAAGKSFHCPRLGQLVTSADCATRYEAGEELCADDNRPCGIGAVALWRRNGN